jgi:nicotinamidase-related amidase
MKLDPSTTALLVMDYQQGIIDRLDDPDDLVARAASALSTARARGAHVGYVRVAFTRADVEALPEESDMRARAEALAADSPATAIDERLAPEPDDIVVRKMRVGPFTTTDLEEQLRSRGVTTLLLAGISTSGVVLSTVREASDRDYDVVVVTDACADPEQDVHEFLMRRIFPRQAELIAVAELDVALGG